MFINQGQSPLDQRALQPWIFPAERGLTRDHRDTQCEPGGSHVAATQAQDGGHITGMGRQVEGL